MFSKFYCSCEPEGILEIQVLYLQLRSDIADLNPSPFAIIEYLAILE
jgi:hypothetical protein